MKDESLNRRAVKSGFFFVVSQILVRGISFITTPVFTRLLSTEQFGQIRVYESWLQIAVPVMSLCLWKSVERAKYDMRDRFDAYTSSVQNLSYISIAFMVGLCMLFKPQIEAFCGMDDTLLYIAFGYIFAYTSVLYMNRREKQSMRYRFATTASMLLVIPATIISILWLYIGNVRGEFDNLVHYRIIGFYGPQIIGGLIIALIMAVQGKKLFSLEFWKYGLLYSLPLIPEVLSIQIMNQADKIMIRKMIGEWETGIFAVGTTVSFIIWILEDSVWNAWLPWFYEKISRDEAEDIAKPWETVMKAFGIISWLLVMLTPEIVLILGGQKNMDAIWVIAPMITGTLFRFYSYSYTAIQNYYKKTTYVAFGTILAMIVNVGLNYICILKFGYRAAAYTTAASYAFLLVFQGWQEMKITGRRIVPLKTTLKLAVIFLILNLVSMLSYRFPFYVRYILVIAGCLYAVKAVMPQFLSILNKVRKK
ncbi:MAG: lipopolysaccharide biosynthesis protein [Muricoprocola sp.]